MQDYKEFNVSNGISTLTVSAKSEFEAIKEAENYLSGRLTIVSSVTLVKQNEYRCRCLFGLDSGINFEVVLTYSSVSEEKPTAKALWNKLVDSDSNMSFINVSETLLLRWTAISAFQILETHKVYEEMK
jgi:hypothetical protein